MIEVATVLLRLPNGDIVFQRRTDDAPTHPGKLGLFGGHIEKGETPDQAVRRELAEETSITSTDFVYLDSKLFDPTQFGPVKFHYYLLDIESDDFQVFEGERAETYSIEQVLARTDLTSTAKYPLELIKEK